LEQPLWIPRLHRFFQTLPTTSTGYGKIAIVDPRGPNPHIPGVIDLAPFKCSGTGEALGDDDHVLVSCGSFPLVIDLHGAEIGPGITQVGGGDEVNFNPGDGRFIVSSNIDGNLANPVVLGAIDSEFGRWLQNVPLPNGLQPGSIRGGNLAAFGENITCSWSCIRLVLPCLRLRSHSLCFVSLGEHRLRRCFRSEA
jgi:hypothetical protein